jgi:hypothetical protein
MLTATVPLNRVPYPVPKVMKSELDAAARVRGAAAVASPVDR